MQLAPHLCASTAFYCWSDQLEQLEGSGQTHRTKIALPRLGGHCSPLSIDWDNQRAKLAKRALQAESDVSEDRRHARNGHAKTEGTA